MIPIIYDRDENLFTSNGLGRIADIASCVVTEEKNGVFECDFEYPVTGINYNLIKVGNIIGVTHDETNDIQPFDIVSCTKPIDGLVTFHAVHISYRQNYLTTSGTNINNIDDAFLMLNNAVPTNPFYYEATFTKNGFLACADGTPRSVREILGGVEGSILDTYGGEYKFDKWNVILYGQRGEPRDITIRYGVNMMDYNDEIDKSSSFNCCVPYWSGSDGLVKASMAQSENYDANTWNMCVPLNLTDKFETKPTTTDLRNAAIDYMDTEQTYLPTQTITVSFARLQDMDEGDNLDSLYNCNLCDTVNVVFPDYGTSGRFKIVKTVWNVLNDKYDEMELGTLSTTLSDALGITNGLERVESKPTPIDLGIDDYITEKGKKTTSGTWYYEKWNSGKIEAWGENSTGTLTMAASGSMYRATNVSVAMASGIFTSTPTYVEAFTSYTSAVFVSASATATSTTNLSCLIWKATNATASVDLKFHVVYYPSNYS